MRAKIVTTITTLLDLDTFASEHEVHISDEDALSEVSRDLVAAAVISGLRTANNALREQFPMVAATLDEEN